MPILATLLAAQSIAAATVGLPPCHAGQLRLSLDGQDGAFNGMSHSGMEVSIRNLGPDCTLPALPQIKLIDTRGRILDAERRLPVGMHPGPVMVPIHLGGGHRAVTDLRWVSGPVFPKNRSVHAATITVRIGSATLRAPLTAVLFGAAGKPVSFEQPQLRVAEGMAAH